MPKFKEVQQQMIDIAGYEGLYAITNCGKVWSYRKNTFLKSYLARGYFKVCLCKDGTHKQLYCKAKIKRIGG